MPNHEQLSRRGFLKAAALAAAGVVVGACQETVPVEKAEEPTPSPEKKSTDEPARTPIVKTLVIEITPTPESTVEPIPTVDKEEKEISFRYFLPDGGDQIVGQPLYIARELEEKRKIADLPAEAQLEFKQTYQPALDFFNQLVNLQAGQPRYGTREGMELLVNEKNPDRFAVRVVQVDGYPLGAIFTPGLEEGSVLTLYPFPARHENEETVFMALTDSNGDFRGWGHFSQIRNEEKEIIEEHLIARVRPETNTWQVGPGEGSEYWRDVFDDLGLEFDGVLANASEMAAVSEALFLAIKKEYPDQPWSEIKKKDWQVATQAMSRGWQVMVATPNGNLYRRSFDEEWGEQFAKQVNGEWVGGLKDEEGKWLKAWVTDKMENVPEGEKRLNNKGQFEVVSEEGVFIYNWQKDRWDFESHPPARDLEKERQEAGEIVGLRTEIRTIKWVREEEDESEELVEELVVWVASVNNPYGLREGQVAGYYESDVEIAEADIESEETRVGGAILRSEVLERLMEDRIARTGEEYVLFVPVDPSGEKGDLVIQRVKYQDGSGFLVECPEGSKVVNFVDGEVRLVHTQDNTGSAYWNPYAILEKDFRRFILIKRQVANSGSLGGKQLGDYLGKVGGELPESFMKVTSGSNAGDWRVLLVVGFGYESADLDLRKLLTVNSHIVFCLANNNSSLTSP